MAENKTARTSADGPEYERGFVDGMQRQMQLHVNRVIKAEPTAWISDSPTKGNGKQLHWTKSEAWRWSSNITPLYTAPKKREWVGLTDDEADELVARFARYELLRKVEAKLKEKNMMPWSMEMKEEWLMPGAVVPVDAETTAALVAEIKRLIWVVGGMALKMQPEREWVGLTDQELEEMHNEIKVRLMGTYRTEDIYRSIEAKLREKNT